MSELNEIGNSYQLTSFFITLLLHCQLLDPRDLYEKFKSDMYADTLYKLHKNFKYLYGVP